MRCASVPAASRSKLVTSNRRTTSVKRAGAGAVGRPQHELLAVVLQQQLLAWRRRRAAGIARPCCAEPGQLVGADAAWPRDAPAASRWSTGAHRRTRRRRRQHRRAVDRQDRAGHRLRLLLAGADQVVAVERQLVGAVDVAHHHRPQEDHQVGLSWCGVSLRNRVPRNGMSPSSGTFSWLPVELVLQQAAQHQDGAVVDQHVRFDRALVGDGPALEVPGATWTLSAEVSWKICMRTVPFSLICGLMRSVRPTSLRSMVWNGLVVADAGVGELAGDEGHVLADDDLGLFVVEREQVRRRQDVGVGLRLQEARDRRQRVGAAVVLAAGRCSGPRRGRVLPSPRDASATGR